MDSIQTTEVFDDWLAGLKDRQAVRRVQVRIDRAEDGNFGDCEPVGEGVSEMRIHYGPGRNPHLNPLVEQLAIRLSTIKPCKSLVIPEGEEAIALSPSGGKLDRGLACISCNAELR